ncbi:MAG: dockerin type I domain-containing protein, partial [Chthoniobacterales bacterium]
NGDHQVILTFAEPVQTMGSVALTSNSGSVTSSVISGATITVNLTGIANQQIITLGLTNVSTGTVSANFSVSMGVLLGDTNGNGTVNASDVGQTKSFSGQALDVTNFRADVNLSGSINASDIGLVKSKAGTLLPP